MVYCLECIGGGGGANPDASEGLTNYFRKPMHCVCSCVCVCVPQSKGTCLTCSTQSQAPGRDFCSFQHPTSVLFQSNCTGTVTALKKNKKTSCLLKHSSDPRLPCALVFEHQTQTLIEAKNSIVIIKLLVSVEKNR